MRNNGGRRAPFIKIVVNWWKILNFKGIGIDVRFNNKLQVVLQGRHDKRLHTTVQFVW